MATCLDPKAAQIEALNLDPIKIKLMDKEDGKNWSREQCDTVERWYKRFLILNLKYPTVFIVPTREIDEFWHFHILDTEKYAEDCQITFGHFLHHFPYFGMRGQDDKKELDRSFTKTKELFLSEFGEPLGKLHAAFGFESAAKCDGSNCSSKDCSSCGKSCSGGKCSPSVDYSIRPAFGY